MAAFGHIKKGQMHRDLGKSQGAPITEADIAKERAKGGVFAKRAQFAENAKHFKHKGKSTGNHHAALARK